MLFFFLSYAPRVIRELQFTECASVDLLFAGRRALDVALARIALAADTGNRIHSLFLLSDVTVSGDPTETNGT